MNAYEPAGAYHCSVRLLYQIIDLIIINTQKYEPAGGYHRSVRLLYQIIDLIIINTEMQAVGHCGRFMKRAATISRNIAVTLHNLQCYVIIM